MADKQTVEAEIRDILGDEDWKYTNKPHRIKQLLIKERQEAYKKGYIDGGIKEITR